MEKISSLAAIIILGCCVVACSTKDTAERDFENGTQAFKNYQFAKAASLSQKAIDLDPENSKYSVLLALSYYYTGDIKSAKELVDKEPLKSCDWTTVLSLRIIIFGHYKMVPELQSVEKELLAKNPDSSFTQHSIALAYLSADHFSEAVPFARKCLSLEDRLNARVLLALALYKSGSVAEAKVILSENDFSAAAIGNDPEKLIVLPTLLLLSKPVGSTKAVDELFDLLLQKMTSIPLVE